MRAEWGKALALAAATAFGHVEGEILLSLALRHIWQRIDRLTGYADFIMQMRPSGTSGRTDIADKIAFFHLLTGNNRHPREMRKACFKLRAVAHLDQIAIGRGIFCSIYDTISSRINRRAACSRQIDAFVTLASASNRVIAHSVIARHPRLRQWHTGRNRYARRNRLTRLAAFVIAPLRHQLPVFGIFVTDHQRRVADGGCGLSAGRNDNIFGLSRSCGNRQ